MPPDRAVRDAATLLDIRLAALRIREFIVGSTDQSFLADAKTQSAVLHQVLVIGEAAKRLSDGFRSAHPEVPWSSMSGMRDRIIHGYDDVDLEEVWRTVTADVPGLLRALEPLLPREHGTEP